MAEDAPEVDPSGPCSEPGCGAVVKGHNVGDSPAVSWFFQKDGSAWCPAHIPEWVEAWRARRDRR